MRGTFHRRALPPLLLLAVLAMGPPASATGVRCDYAAPVLTVNISVPATIFVTAGDEIKVRTSTKVFDCGSATTGNTSDVEVGGSSAADTFQIDQNGPGGSFPHMKQWDIDLGMGSDVVRVLGRPVLDRVYVNKAVIGSNTFDTIDTNGDGNPNIDLINIQRVEIRSFGGNDQIGVSGSGYQASGLIDLFPARLPLILKSGPGNDNLTGGIKNDTAVAGAGNDDLKGGKGADTLKGQGGADHMNGGPGNDTCLGGPGQDTAVQCE
jgi:Ca2+-binding RTX toxin-like protein